MHLVWGTGVNDPINWLGNTNPTLKSNVLFNSVFVSSPQNIDVTGSDKVVSNMYFSGPNAYTLTTSESRKIIFDNDATTGGITTSPSPTTPPATPITRSVLPSR